MKKGTKILSDLEELQSRTLLRPGLSLDEDRKRELEEFLETDSLRGTSGESRPSAGPSDYTTDLTPLDDRALFEYLERTALSGISRNLLKSVRLREAAGLVAALEERFGSRERAEVRVLDFGCGCSDHGLALALAGFSVAVADIPSKVRFAAWRYERRGLPVEAIEINSSNWRVPPIGSRDAIICGEVLEHLRYPLETAIAFRHSLPPGGVLWVSAYPFREKRRGGSHLEEAWNQRLAVRRELKRNYKRLRRDGLPGYLLVHRRPGFLARMLRGA